MPLPPLAAEYAHALADHLAHADEASRARAYAIGRAALARGGGILDLVAIHHQALAASLADGADPGRLALAAEFLAEALAPFEMSQRGYRDANARLQQVNQELEAFSYSVAHDLRAPLRAIDGFCTILVRDYQDRLDPRCRQYLERVRLAAQRMARMIEDLLALSRTNRGELRRERIDLAAMAREVMARLMEARPERQVAFVAPERLPALGDAHLIGLVLDNLLGNAWKYTSRHAAARIELGVRPGHPPAYYVRDDGAGFDMAYAERLFGVFQRLHAETEFEGTGIGLATVQRIVHRHGGRLWAEGAVERGAVFYFTLEGE